MRVLVLIAMAACGGHGDRCDPWSRDSVRGFSCSGSATPYLGQDDGGTNHYQGGYSWCYPALQQDAAGLTEWQCG